MKYRAEIDGLRAIAVVPVILFHAGIDLFSGGYVGVDVFFVISGYLITALILEELAAGRFSLRLFYERRARRILPALFLVMLVSIPFARAWLLPADLVDFHQSLVAVSAFVSNILFWQETGYWGTANELKPLLHTWSLAVEEQYYLLFPLFLMLLWQFWRRWILVAFLCIVVSSLALAEWSAHHWPVANFFLLTSRGWELAIGASIAYCFLHRQQAMQSLLTGKASTEIMGLLGLCLVAFAVFAFDETVPFPGLYALVPTLGTGLVIVFASPRTLAGRLLGSRFLVGIGLISYSAYLWHQPLLAFARYRVLTNPGDFTLIVLAGLSFPLAYLSWKYVEQPFRDRKAIGRKAIFIFAVAGSLAFLLFGLAGLMMEHFNKRTTHSQFTLDAIEKKLVVNAGLDRSCDRTFTLSAKCRTSDEPAILVWGDSYAMHLVPGILAANPGARIIQMTKTACGPFFDLAPIDRPRYPESRGEDCLAFTAQVRAWLQDNDSVKYAVLSSSFGGYLAGDKQLLWRDGQITPAGHEAASRELAKTLSELEAMGIQPVIFTPPPANGNNLGNCLAMAERAGTDLETCNFQARDIAAYRTAVYEFLESFTRRVPVIRLDKLVCEDAVCRTHEGGTYFYRDTGHLSLEGSAFLGKQYDFYNMITGDNSHITPWKNRE